MDTRLPVTAWEGRDAEPAYVIIRSLTVKGFALGAYLHLAREFNQHMTEWFTAGEIAYDEKVTDGIDPAVDAFIEMMRGANTGRMPARSGLETWS
ncbi:hypothetical protein [Streptomyces sp. NPDC002845]